MYKGANTLKQRQQREQLNNQQVGSRGKRLQEE